MNRREFIKKSSILATLITAFPIKAIELFEKSREVKLTIGLPFFDTKLLKFGAWFFKVENKSWEWIEQITVSNAGKCVVTLPMKLYEEGYISQLSLYTV